MKKFTKAVMTGLILASIPVSQGHANDYIFGYWANLDVPTNHSHTTMTHIWSRHGDRNDAIAAILSQLQLADQYGIKAAVSLDPFLFSAGLDQSGIMTCPYSQLANSHIYFDDLVDELVSNNYLIPQDPENSTVIAFIPVDEPELCGLQDSGSSAHPALASAYNTVRSHTDTSNFPIWTNVHNYSSVIKGLQLADWVSYDNYNLSTSNYLSQFSNLTNYMLPSQKAILIPQASHGGFMSSYGNWHDPEAIFDHMLSDSTFIGIIPFLWEAQGTQGTSQIPQLLSAYSNIGGQIKNGKPISIDVSCSQHLTNPHYQTCNANANGGWNPLSYQWVGCSGVGSQSSCYTGCTPVTEPFRTSVQVSVTVSDSLGFDRVGQKSIVAPWCGTQIDSTDNDQ